MSLVVSLIMSLVVELTASLAVRLVMSLVAISSISLVVGLLGCLCLAGRFFSHVTGHGTNAEMSVFLAIGPMVSAKL